MNNTRRKFCALLCVVATVSCLLQPANLLAGPGYTPVRDVDNPITNPFAVEVSWFESNTYNPGSYTVPAGKRLEITGISGITYAPLSTNVYVTIQATVGGVSITHRLALMVNDSTLGTGYWVMLYKPVNLYADPGSTINLVVRRDFQPGTGTSYYCDLVLSGRLVNL